MLISKSEQMFKIGANTGKLKTLYTVCSASLIYLITSKDEIISFI